MPLSSPGPAVPLHTTKGMEARLCYGRFPLSLGQARFKGRLALEPEIDLSSFKCRAVIDWLDLSLKVRRPTQGRWMCGTIKKAHSISVYAQGAADNRTTTEFSLRFQEPNVGLLVSAISTLDQKYGVQDEVKVVGAEVSVDFYPREVGNDWHRWRLMAVLARHLLPSRDVTAQRLDMPRCNWGTRKETVFFFPQKPVGDVDPVRFLFNGNDRSPFVDATVYFGAKLSSPKWRVMDKILDAQNKVRGTKILLPDERKRVRVEVTLDEMDLQEAGIVHLTDLGSGALTRLQGRHLQWVLPTFENLDQYAPGRRRSLAAYVEQERELKFLTTGVVGLDAMDRQWTKVREQHRKGMVARGLNVPRPRVGKGKRNSFLAYPALNGKVAMAVEKLTGRIGKQLSRLTPLNKLLEPRNA